MREAESPDAAAPSNAASASSKSPVDSPVRWKDWDQSLQALRAPRIGLQACGQQPNVRGIIRGRATAADARATHGHSANSGDNVRLRPFAMANTAPATSPASASTARTKQGPRQQGLRQQGLRHQVARQQVAWPERPAPTWPAPTWHALWGAAHPSTHLPRVPAEPVRRHDSWSRRLAP